MKNTQSMQNLWAAGSLCREGQCCSFGRTFLLVLHTRTPPPPSGNGKVWLLIYSTKLILSYERQRCFKRNKQKTSTGHSLSGEVELRFCILLHQKCLSQQRVPQVGARLG